MISKRRFTIIAVIGLALCIGLWASLTRSGAPTEQPSAAPKPGAVQGSQHANAAPAPTANAADWTENIQRLIDAANQGDAQSAYQAYLLLEQCWIADFIAGPSTDRIDGAEVLQTQTDFLRQQRNTRELCKRVPAAIHADRFRLIHIAAQARIPGAAYAFARAGPPAGEYALQTQPDDPGVAMWKQEAEHFLKEAATTGDLESMYALSTSYQMGIYTRQDPVEALAYAHAYAQRQQMLDDRKLSPGYARLLEVLSRGLPAEQQRAAQERGLAIAAAGPLPRAQPSH